MNVYKTVYQNNKVFVKMTETAEVKEARMSNNRITKEALANALKKLLEQQPLSKISVKYITDY